MSIHKSFFPKTKITPRLFGFAGSASLIACFCLLSFVLSAQSPNKINYQAVARNAGGTPIVSTPIYVKFQIHQATSGGAVVFEETHSVTTNAFGLFTLEIGGGTLLSGNFSTIPWGMNLFFLEVFVDPDAAGGSPYVSMGTTQFLSVPYAMHSTTSGNGLPSGTSGQTLRHNGTNWISNSNLFNDGTNVAIGFSTPSYNLDVLGTARINPTLYVSGNAGIGTFSIAPSALLDMVSTTRGLLAPRMTGAQMTAIATPANGLLVYNTDSVAFCYYNGTAWRKIYSPGGAPANIWSRSAPNTFLTNSGDSVGIGVSAPTQAKVEIRKTGGATDALYVSTSGTGRAAHFQNLNTGSSSAALKVTTNGSAPAGYFEISTAGSNAIGVHGYTSGTGSAGLFQINNSSSSAHTLRATNIGSGSAIFASIASPGTGRAGYFEITNASNASDALYSTTLGGANSKAIYGKHTGTGVVYGVFGEATGSGGSVGVYGYASNASGTNNYGVAGFNQSASSGYGILGQGFYGVYGQTTSSSGYGVYGIANNSGSTGVAGFSNTASGRAGHFEINNAGNPSSALYVKTNGTGVAGEFVGKIKIVDGTQAANYVLTSDAGGAASWMAPTGGGWGLLGNATTVDGVNFIGTTDNVAFSIRVNNQKSGRIDPIAAIANTFFGYQSGNVNSTGYQNTAVGYQSLAVNTTGQSNTAIGYKTLNNNVGGYSNTALGSEALSANTTGQGNTAIGLKALFSNSIGFNNTSIGYNAGLNSTGNGNVFIGYEAGLNETGSNKLYIANTGTNPPLIYGDFASGNVGIGTVAPGAKLEVAGQIKIVDGTQGVGKVLTSDAAGNASWMAPAALGSWSTSGNPLTGTLPSTPNEWIGSSNAADFIFRTNNIERMRILSGGIVNISNTLRAGNGSTATPSYSFGSVTNTGMYLSGTGMGFSENGTLRLEILGGIGATQAYGQFRGIAGNQGTPSFAFSTSTTTGMFSPAVNQLAFTTNGAERIRIDASGNVGIGTTPGTKLDMAFTGNAAAFRMRNTNAPTTSGEQAVIDVGFSNTRRVGIGSAADAGVAPVYNGFNYIVSQGKPLTIIDESDANVMTFVSGNVGIGTTIPGEKLEVAGKTKTTNFQMTNGGALNYVLTSDASGNASWAAPVAASNDWTVTGNTGTVDGANFIGTFDNIPLTFRVNNQKAGRIDQLASNSFFGYWSGLNATGNQNSAYGTNSLMNTNTGVRNTAMGVAALQTNTTGSDNTAIGAFADVSSPGLTNATAIGANAVVAQSNALILGNNANVGIGTSTPTGGKLDVQSSTGTAVSGLTTSGSGNAGSFIVSNAGNSATSLYTTHNGSGYSLLSTNTGTGVAGYFQISNNANANNALQSATSGSGSAVSGITTGSGMAGRFEINNGANLDYALYATTNGTGNVIVGTTSNSGHAVVGSTSGSGRAVNGINTGTGYAGYFQINNASNTLNALFATTNGPGAAINATNTYNGASALRDGIRVAVTGTGGTTNTAGYFSASGSTINNALHLDYGHLKATGPAPTITGGTLGGTSLAGGSTDIKGTINSTGAVPNNSTATVIIDFNMPYATVPVVVITAAGAGVNVYRLTYAVTSVSTTSFTITLYNNNTGGGIPSPTINYMVIE